MDAKNWNKIIASFPEPHLLQTWEWGQVKAKYGWSPIYKVWRDDNKKIEAAALVLERTIPIIGISAQVRMLYAPKGPLLMDWDDAELRRRVLSDLGDLAKERGAFVIKLDPDVRLGSGVPGDEGAQENALGQTFVNQLRAAGWRYSGEQVQFRNTVLLDLRVPEDDLLAGMKQKTRYNVRLAGRKGVTVRTGGPDDFNMLYRMYTQTAVRDGFVIRHQDYYFDLWNEFYQQGMLKPLIAEVEGEALAGLMLFMFAGRAWYVHGMSSGGQRAKMPTYLLQWEAIRAAKSAGCTRYDLWGAPEVFDETDSMWGVYRFKRGLGGQVARHIGAWDLPVKPWLYWLYTRALPRLLAIMRRLGRKRAAHEVQQRE